MKLEGVIEGILFAVGDEGITLDTLINILGSDENLVKEALTNLRREYESESRGIRISFLGNTFKLTTKKEHKEYYERLLTDNRTYTLSNAALEVLAIVAYNEPITRVKIDEIRGVNSSQIVRKLIAMNMIKECGKAQTIGRPNLYKTTNDFLDYFGLATKDDLPSIQINENNDDETELYTSTYKDKNV